MDKIIIGLTGLIGVIVGALLTIAKEWWFEKKRNKKAGEYLSIRIICILDHFLEDCVDIACDDLIHGNLTVNSDLINITNRLPNFDPEFLDVDWKSLPTPLIYEILILPSRIETAKNKINNTFEYGASAPDYIEGFKEIQYQYAVLGIAASEITSKLRNLSGLPEKETSDDWDPIEILTNKESEQSKNGNGTRSTSYRNRDRNAATCAGAGGTASSTPAAPIASAKRVATSSGT